MSRTKTTGKPRGAYGRACAVLEAMLIDIAIGAANERDGAAVIEVNDVVIEVTLKARRRRIDGQEPER